MSKYAYRVDATSPNRRAGETGFLLATSKTAALHAFQTARPQMDGWDFEVSKISKDEMPPVFEPPVLELPVPDPERVAEALRDLRRGGVAHPVLLTQYPWDVVDGDVDTRDTVVLGRRGEACIVDAGDPTEDEGDPT